MIFKPLLKRLYKPYTEIVRLGFTIFLFLWPNEQYVAVHWVYTISFCEQKNKGNIPPPNHGSSKLIWKILCTYTPGERLL